MCRFLSPTCLLPFTSFASRQPVDGVGPFLFCFHLVSTYCFPGLLMKAFVLLLLFSSNLLLFDGLPVAFFLNSILIGGLLAMVECRL
jgi:hypothetical protein